MANHPRSQPSLASLSEVRGLCSAGVTRPRRSYAPVRLPPVAATPRMASRLAPRQGGSPLSVFVVPFRRAVPNTPADRNGASVDVFPPHAAFPVTVAGRTFEACSGFTILRPSRVHTVTVYVIPNPAPCAASFFSPLRLGPVLWTP